MDKNTNRRPRRPSRPAGKPHREETVYTEAKPVNISRFFIRIVTVMAVVFAIVFGMSIFFKAEKIEVAGVDKYTVKQVQEASGIMSGTNLLTLNKGQVVGRILTKLPYIKEVRIGIRLPDTVVISVTEAAVAYAAKDTNGGWWVLNCEGKVMERIDASTSGNYPRILGVLLENPVAGKNAVAYENSADTNGGEAATVPVTVYNRERLAAALQIAKEMELNGVLGDVATIDVTDMGNIEAWYGTRFQILLGDSTEIPKKVFSAVQAIYQLGQYQSGVLDASFTTWPEEVYHKAFD
ncbi:MAG: FtsQ-type POTRA domain-containing protein [Oscillospiraceae bacterium]|nr:FtsQ-type POTRA domain-containing protein [Oscillospiraceae bacterium]